MPDAVTPRRPVVIETDVASSFVCDYVAGINRVLSLPPCLLIDNIGRNVEVWQFQPGEREPAARMRYDLTAYPGDPMASLLDVDVHAAFLRHDSRQLLVVNHYGRVRAFEVPAPFAALRPAWELQLPGDTERIVMAGDCFATSSPRGEFTDDPAQPGVLLFEPIGAPEPAAGETTRLACDQVLADWGVISALTVSAAADRLAVGAGQRLGVFQLKCSSTGLRLGHCLWEATLRFHCQWLHIDGFGRLWTGGHRPSSSAAAGDEWDACLGGDVDVFAMDDGAPRFTVALPDMTSWGYGADPIVLTPDGGELYVLGRDASLHVIDVTTRASQELYAALEAPDGTASASLGIGHAALRDRWIYAGFSRGGFRLLRYETRRADIRHAD